MDLGINNKKVLITGGSRGLGLALAKAFKEEGCKVIIISRNKKSCGEAIKMLGGKKKGHDFFTANLLDYKKNELLLKKILAKHKSIDIVIHNVGGGLGLKNPTDKIENWIKSWIFNVGISIQINNFLLPIMKKKKWGRVVNISSLASINGLPRIEPYGGSVAYSCSKNYLNMYTKTMAREYAKFNISISAVLPGPFLSPGKHWDKLKKKNNKLFNLYVKNLNSLERFSKVEEVVPFVLLLASEKASSAQGALVNIDGGAY